MGNIPRLIIMFQRIFNDGKKYFYHLRKRILEKSLEENNTQKKINKRLSKVISGFKIINFDTGTIIQMIQSLLFQKSYKE